jgi:alkylhydroperoxidase family enzyme
MAFIPHVPEVDQPAEFRVPDRDNILQVHGVHPAAMRRHYDLYVALMHARGPLERRQREMVAVTVSAINECRY